MRLLTRILFGLTGFLGLAAAVYWWTSHRGLGRDPAGPALLLVAGIAFGYAGLVLRGAARRADRETAAAQAAPGGQVAGAHVHPTIWPFAFSIAALALVVGAVVATRILVPVGLALFAAAAVGWFADIRRAHRR